MNKKLHVAIAMLGSMFACSLAGAQTHGGGVSVQPPSGPARPAARITSAPSIGIATASPAVHQTSALRISTRGHAASGFAHFTDSVEFGAGIGVPGLGFDYPHLAAISGGFQSDPRRSFQRERHHEPANIVPIFLGGVPYYLDGQPDYQQPQQQEQPQPQVIVIQLPAPSAAEQPVPRPADSGTDAVTSSAVSSPAPEAPVQNVGELILVLKDGRLLFATAFSVVAGQLRYITPEGILRKFPITELDSDATEQMNEAHGNTVQFNN